MELLASQFSSETELGVEFVEERSHIGNSLSLEVYRLYTKQHSENDFDRDRFIIQRVRRSGKIREYCLDGDIYFRQ